jgi:hypothetical protein
MLKAAKLSKRIRHSMLLINRFAHRYLLRQKFRKIVKLLVSKIKDSILRIQRAVKWRMRFRSIMVEIAKKVAKNSQAKSANLLGQTSFH